ncbi:MAG: hypothetical protein VX642_14575, partial [Bdellovibrionota bacterium]|nr:hypothetical protein [Bdellovibrionota bacterium]
VGSMDGAVLGGWFYGGKTGKGGDNAGAGGAGGAKRKGSAEIVAGRVLATAAGAGHKLAGTVVLLAMYEELKLFEEPSKNL